MTAGFDVDVAVLLAGLLLAVGVIGSSLASRYRVPSLLLFLGLGMLVADDGLAFVSFDDAALAQNIAAVALVIILFEGGLTTTPSSFRSVGVPAALLATAGVAVTAGVVAGAAWLLLDVAPTTALLLGAVVSSTDAAAVFAALRDEPLPHRVRRLLQLESGMNDPVAVLLTVGAVETWRAQPDALDWTTFVAVQLVGGAVVGVGVGVVARWATRALHARVNTGFSVFSLALAALSYGTAAAVGASGFLAVYLTGVLLAADERPVRRVLAFHEGLAATAQAVLFLLLGILVFPSQLVDDLGRAVLLTAVLVLVARPIAVHCVLAAVRMPVAEAVLVSWAGLRGAVPVVMATIPLTAEHPDGALVFDVAFVVVVISVAIQAPSVALVARRLGLPDQPSGPQKLEVVPVDVLDADVVDIVVPADAAVCGATLAEVPLPAGTRIVVIGRAGTSVIPDGSTRIEADDRLLLVVPGSFDLALLDLWVDQSTDTPPRPLRTDS